MKLQDIQAEIYLQLIQMKMHSNVKNILLAIVCFISLLPSIFYGEETRINMGFFVDRPTRIDYFVKNYGNLISFLIYAYCLKYPKGINKELLTAVLLISVLDLLHYILFSGASLLYIKLIIGFGYGFRERFIQLFKYIKSYVS